DIPSAFASRMAATRASTPSPVSKRRAMPRSGVLVTANFAASDSLSAINVLLSTTPLSTDRNAGLPGGAGAVEASRFTKQGPGGMRPGPVVHRTTDPDSAGHAVVVVLRAERLEERDRRRVRLHPLDRSV